ncbi:hypothetical protein HMPREF9464_01854 [Sutterella wadsworthensis 3_1_45B]|jgi:predicted DNA-binding transcriptional regulator AlpA|nr:hypothetical protein HMPREF9464_01854 [Sutterella wadsworthensis 3_1_45B]
MRLMSLALVFTPSSDPTFPQPIYFGPKVARFKVEDVRRWVKQLEAGKPTEDPLAA